MPHVITQSCCNDASCVSACPVNCIHPTPEEPGFATADMLYIDPATCTDCGACVSECPTDAIASDTELVGSQRRYLSINADYYKDHSVHSGLIPWRPPVSANQTEPARIAIVGAGPAGFYAAKRLLMEPNVELDLFDRLPTPYGLVRGGVAPDHTSTKKVERIFESVSASARLRYMLGVDVGRHIRVRELASAYHAVLYAHGASDAKSLGIPGEGLGGSIAATEFVGWYNGQPGHAQYEYDLSGERAVVIGNGNVALDVARILLSDPEHLAATDMAEHALNALLHSNIREVVVVARRGPADAAYTIGEFAEIAELPGVDVTFDYEGAASGGPVMDSTTAAKINLIHEIASRQRTRANRHLVFRYQTTPMEILGDDVSGVTGLTVMRSHSSEIIKTGLVIRAVGYVGRPLDSLPFDVERGTVPNDAGRVIDPETGEHLAGQYVAGWIKRGPRGGIGANRFCGEETAVSIIEDMRDGLLPTGTIADIDVCGLLRSRGVSIVDQGAWNRIDDTERSAGERLGRERVKLVTVDALMSAARQ
ncbi:FAD-dependent oxidoreductase [Mycobacteroides abscessus]|uniref:FAD-dependent oxidoreductase n=1 Tax=Mycobacteroides abscessus TaxID=36809 RepID=UPI0021049C4B|nr:FAD-dependent oxidoreductase [Mycobacteroides abscessus]